MSWYDDLSDILRHQATLPSAPSYASFPSTDTAFHAGSSFPFWPEATNAPSGAEAPQKPVVAHLGRNRMRENVERLQKWLDACYDEWLEKYERQRCMRPYELVHLTSLRYILDADDIPAEEDLDPMGFRKQPVPHVGAQLLQRKFEQIVQAKPEWTLTDNENRVWLPTRRWMRIVSALVEVVNKQVEQEIREANAQLPSWEQVVPEEHKVFLPVRFQKWLDSNRPHTGTAPQVAQAEIRPSMEASDEAPDSNAPSTQKASSASPMPRLPNRIEREILNLLIGTAFTAKELTHELEKKGIFKETRTIEKTLAKMKHSGCIDNQSGLGYYRPDCPPSP